MFVAFDREEQGLYGSKAYADAHAGDNILGMLSLDMIAYNIPGTGHDTVRFYDSVPGGAIKSELAAAFAAYGGGLATVDSGLEYGSDHSPFEQKGFDAALVIEYAVRDNPYYHKATDAVESANYIDYVYATKVTRGVLGYLATAAGLISPSDLLTATVSGQDLILDYAADAHGIADIRVRATDTQNLFAEDTFRVTVTPVNDAPLLDNAGAMTLAAIDEDPVSNPGTLVRDIVASAGGDRITDADQGALEGIAVTAVDNAHGTWQYTINNGRTWLAFGTPTAATARLLGSDAGTRVRFVPAADWHGTVDPGLTFRAWDHTQGFNGQTADASAGGGATAFSAAIETAAITVNQAVGVVVGRHVFYNQSYFDGNNAAADAGDDAAIATDKQALLPGTVAAFANYTSYSRGINGILVDIAGLADPASLTAASFEFRVGNTNTPAGWALAAHAQQRDGADRGGRRRFGPRDADLAQRRDSKAVVAGDRQGGCRNRFGRGRRVLFRQCCRRFGQQRRPTRSWTVPTSPGRGINPRNFLNRAGILDFRYDYNRDSFVDGTDLAVARDNNTNFLTALTLLDLSTASPAMPLASGSGTDLPEAEGEAALPTFPGWLPTSPQLVRPAASAAEEPSASQLLRTHRDPTRQASPRTGELAKASRLGSKAGSSSPLAIRGAASSQDDLQWDPVESVLEDIAAAVAQAWDHGDGPETR